MKIITRQLAAKLPAEHKLLLNRIVNPQDITEICAILKEIKEVTIYDLTITKDHPTNSVISVCDHINRTGINPLIGKQKTLGLHFTNMAKTYKYEKPSIITNCCGKKLNKTHAYPSHYLSNISILAKTLNIKRISANLVNII